VNWDLLGYDRHNILMSFYGKRCDLLSLGSNDLIGFCKLRSQVFHHRRVLNHNAFVSSCEHLCTRASLFLNRSSFFCFLLFRSSL
jgi:hypothetical protein